MNEFIEVTTPNHDRMRVSRKGGRLTLELGGELILGEYVRGDAKPGTTHICTPIFGPDKNNLYGLVQHGDMRNQECSVEKSGETAITVSHTINDEGYPAGVMVNEELIIDSLSAGRQDAEFSFVLTHTNNGEKEVAVNAGLHCYFDAPRGYVGTRVNGVDITKYIEDNVNGYLFNAPETYIVSIPGKPDYIVAQQGFEYCMVWVGRNPKTGELDKDYVCVEPVEMNPDAFGSPDSMIDPGSARTSRLRLGLKTD